MCIAKIYSPIIIHAKHGNSNKSTTRKISESFLTTIHDLEADSTFFP